MHYLKPIFKKIFAAFPDDPNHIDIIAYFNRYPIPVALVEILLAIACAILIAEQLIWASQRLRACWSKDVSNGAATPGPTEKPAVNDIFKANFIAVHAAAMEELKEYMCQLVMMHNASMQQDSEYVFSAPTQLKVQSIVNATVSEEETAEDKTIIMTEHDRQPLLEVPQQPAPLFHSPEQLLQLFQSQSLQPPQRTGNLGKTLPWKPLFVWSFILLCLVALPISQPALVTLSPTPALTSLHAIAFTFPPFAPTLPLPFFFPGVT